MAIRVRFFSVVLVLFGAAGCGGRGGPASNLYFAALTEATPGQLSSQGQSALLEGASGAVACFACSNLTESV